MASAAAGAGAVSLGWGHDCGSLKGIRMKETCAEESRERDVRVEMEGTR